MLKGYSHEAEQNLKPGRRLPIGCHKLPYSLQWTRIVTDIKRDYHNSHQSIDDRLSRSGGGAIGCLELSAARRASCTVSNNSVLV
jgi:hypothetical protein